MTSYLLEYLPILLFVFIGLGIAIFMTAFSFVFGSSNPDKEKLGLSTGLNVCHPITKKPLPIKVITFFL